MLAFCGFEVGMMVDVFAGHALPTLRQGLPIIVVPRNLPVGSFVGQHAGSFAGAISGFVLGSVFGGVFAYGGRSLVAKIWLSFFRMTPVKVTNGSSQPPNGRFAALMMLARGAFGIASLYFFVAAGAVLGACVGALGGRGVGAGLVRFFSMDVAVTSCAAVGASIGSLIGGCIGSIFDARIGAKVVQSKLLYHPRKYRGASPTGLSYMTMDEQPYALETVKYKLGPWPWSKADQTGFLLKPVGEEVKVLWCIFGGNAMVAYDWLPFCQKLISKDAAGRGRAFLLMDYPGYGANEGQPSPSLVLHASRQLLTAAIARLGCVQPQVNLLGHSLGASVAVRLAGSLRCSGIVPGHLVLSAPFLTIPHVVVNLFGSVTSRCPRLVSFVLLPLLRVLIPHTWNNIRAVPRAAKHKWQISIIHGGQDKLVPVTHGRELFRIAHRALGTRANFFELPQAGHNDLLALGFEHYVNFVCSSVEERFL